MTSKDFAEVIKTSLNALNKKAQSACHPQPGSLRVKIQLDPTKGKALGVAIQGGSLAKTKDEGKRLLFWTWFITPS